MAWAVIGNAGMFGYEMQTQLLSRGETVIGFNRANISLMTKPCDIAKAIRAQSIGNVTTIVNAVGYTQVDLAEQEADQAYLINRDLPAKLAEVSNLLGCKFIHISTDYVFDGNAEYPYKVTDQTSPTTVYGKSKLAGEVAVEEIAEQYQIFRTAWLYGSNGTCFPKTIASKIILGEKVKVVSDQFGQPTWARDLADLIIMHNSNAREDLPSLVHGTATGVTSWYEFAREIARSLNLESAGLVVPVTSNEFKTHARRPKYSALDNEDKSGFKIGDWLERWRVASHSVLGQ